VLVRELTQNRQENSKYKCKKTKVYTNVNSDIVSYTSKTAKIKKADISQKHMSH